MEKGTYNNIIKKMTSKRKMTLERPLCLP